jgi:hypothetical protein
MMHRAAHPFPCAEQNPKEIQYLGARGGEHSERENTERNGKLHRNDAKRRAKCVQSVRGTFTGIGPPESRAASPQDVVIAYCQGTPLTNEIEARDPSRLEEATQTVTEALAQRFGSGPVEGRIRAHVITSIQ